MMTRNIFIITKQMLLYQLEIGLGWCNDLDDDKKYFQNSQNNSLMFKSNQDGSEIDDDKKYFHNSQTNALIFIEDQDGAMILMTTRNIFKIPHKNL